MVPLSSSSVIAHALIALGRLMLVPRVVLYKSREVSVGLILVRVELPQVVVVVGAGPAVVLVLAH